VVNTMSWNKEAFEVGTNQYDKLNTAPDQRRYLIRPYARIDDIAILLNGDEKSSESRGQDLALAICIGLDNLLR
jgi:hypothetical protein